MDENNSNDEIFLYDLAYYKSGLEKFKLGKFIEAIKDFDMSIEINPFNEGSYFIRGNSHFNLGNYKNAINDFNSTTKINPNKIEAHFYNGISQIQLKNYNEAINIFNKAIEIDPNSAPLYNNRSIAKFHLGNYKEAIDDSNRAIRIDPSHFYAYASRGLARKELRDFEEAINDFTLVIMLDNKNAVAYLNRGLLKIILDKYNDAINDINIAIDINPKLFNKDLIRKTNGLYVLLKPKKNEPYDLVQEMLNTVFPKGEKDINAGTNELLFILNNNISRDDARIIFAKAVGISRLSDKFDEGELINHLAEYSLQHFNDKQISDFHGYLVSLIAAMTVHGCSPSEVRRNGNIYVW